MNPSDLGDHNGYRPGVNGTKLKRFARMNELGLVFYPPVKKMCTWETEFDRKQKTKEEREKRETEK